MIKAHCEVGTVVLSDQHSSYVLLRQSRSNLTKHGFYHFWVNHSNFYVHEKYPFIFTANIERTWSRIKRTQPALKVQRKSHRTAEYLSVYTLSQIIKRHMQYDWTLKLIREYFVEMFDRYRDMTRNEEFKVPGIGKIDIICE